MRNGAVSENGHGGGAQDICGGDCASVDQLITPWSASVASGCTLLRDPRYNKGLGFTEKERDAHYLRGLLPPAVLTQELQEKRLMHTIRQYEVPLHKYIAMMDLQVHVGLACTLPHGVHSCQKKWKLGANPY